MKSRFLTTMLHITTNRHTTYQLGNLAGIALISFSVALSSSDNNAKVWDQPFYFYFGVALPAVMGLAIATWMASKFQLAKPERVAVAVESCYQNTGIATSVAITMFEGDDLAVAVGVPLFYGICEAVLLAGFCLTAWKMGWTKAPPNENFCVVIAKSYEVQQAEVEDPDAIEVVLGLDDKEGGGDIHDLIFSQTGEGYQIDEESLHSLSNSLSNPQDTPFELSPTRRDDDDNDDNNDSGSPVDDDNNTRRKIGQRRKYEQLKVWSPNSGTRTPSPVPVPSTLMVPPLDDDETPSSRRSADSNVGRLGRAVTTIRARVQGYQKALIVESISPTSRESSCEDSEALSMNDAAPATVETGDIPFSSIPLSLDEESPSTAVRRESFSGKSFD